MCAGDTLMALHAPRKEKPGHSQTLSNLVTHSYEEQHPAPGYAAEDVTGQQLDMMIEDGLTDAAIFQTYLDAVQEENEAKREQLHDTFTAIEQSLEPRSEAGEREPGHIPFWPTPTPSAPHRRNDPGDAYPHERYAQRHGLQIPDLDCVTRHLDNPDSVAPLIGQAWKHMMHTLRRVHAEEHMASGEAALPAAVQRSANQRFVAFLDTYLADTEENVETAVSRIRAATDEDGGVYLTAARETRGSEEESSGAGRIGDERYDQEAEFFFDSGPKADPHTGYDDTPDAAPSRPKQPQTLPPLLSTETGIVN